MEPAQMEREGLNRCYLSQQPGYAAVACVLYLLPVVTEGAREALSTPKHPKLTKVKNNPFLAPHDRPFFKEGHLEGEDYSLPFMY